jgi:hypothetical protein
MRRLANVLVLLLALAVAAGLGAAAVVKARDLAGRPAATDSA